MIRGKGLLSLCPVFLLFISCNPQREEHNSIDYVNTFIGTAAYGNTFPGAALPFGMVQLSPATGAIRDKGYSYSKSVHGRDSETILGFTHTHLSGTGIGHIAKYGNISFMPTTGPLKTDPGTEDNPETGYRSRYSHENEEAGTGYYKVLLEDYNITAELTVTERVGVHRYTFPDTCDGHIIIDITRERARPELHKEAFIEVIGNNQVRGYTTVIGFATGEPMTWYFFAEFSKSFDSFGTFNDGVIYENDRKARGTKGVGAFIKYSVPNNEEVIAKVGISFTGMEGAKKNLMAEVPGWNFDQVRKNAQDIWNEKLNKIQVAGGTRINKIKFYTALYHSLLFPRMFSDVDGAYYSHFLDSIIIEQDFRYYVDFSLWDTYRTQHPLLNIIEPERQTEMIKTMLAMYEQGGRIPSQVSYRNFYSWAMIGDHGSSTIIDSYMKGLRDFDINKAYEGMRKNAFESGLPDRSLVGLDTYMNIGYVTAERERESVSKTLEYSYTDWALAQVSKELGKTDDYEVLMRRANNYKNLFDAVTGFYRPKFSDGTWLQICEPHKNPEIAVWGNNTYYDCWNKWWIGISPHRHYTESNAYQYLFNPQHDPQGLINLMGGRIRFIEKLNELFYTSSANEGPWYVGVTGVMGQYVHGNQPSMHVPYLYNYAGQPWKTQERTRLILESLYGPDAWGLPGNDDMGTMSAWYIFSALGFYPVTPGQPVYVLTSPQFEKAVIQLDEYYGNRKFTVKANHASGDNKYIQSAMLNGKPLNRTWITHEEIIKGGKLEFIMGPYPNMEWGTTFEAAPPSMTKK